MNSRLVEARELAARISRILQAGGPPSLLQVFATETHQAWQRLLGDGEKARACVPASGDDLELLLGQIGLTAVPVEGDTVLHV